MSSVYDATAIRAALSHINGDLFNVNAYIVHIQNKTENGTDRKDSAFQTKSLLNWGNETYLILIKIRNEIL